MRVRWAQTTPGRGATAAALALWLGACGGGSGSPTAPSGPVATPTPGPTSTHPVRGLVYYDENGNGALDDGEQVRMPAIGVELGGRNAATGADGRFLVNDVPAGARTPSLSTPSLPPSFQAGTLAAVTVPTADSFELALPVVLPIGSNRPNVYMAFGDSITLGDGSSGRRGYRGPLEASLSSYWGGRVRVENQGIESTRSNQGADRLPGSLAQVRPAYVVILYGTNDWNEFSCRRATQCFTQDAVRSMIRSARAANTIPVVGTIIPANPAFVDRSPADRNAWVEELNSLLRPICQQEGAILADTHAAFVREAGGDLASLFSDHVHPNNRGYDAIAQEFFRAITQPRGSAGS